MEQQSRTGLGRVKRSVPVLAAALLVLLVVGGYAASVLLRDDPGRQGEPRAAQPAEPSSSPGRCTVDRLLVNSCRPWFGGTSNHYPEATTWDKRDQTLAFERRLGRKVDVVHSYHVAGDNALSEADVTFARRPGTLLLTNWQPAKDWRSASGGDPAVDAGIDEMARSIKALGETRILLAVFHEPENDLSRAPAPCGPDVQAAGTSGTAEDYRAMWRNVRQRFDALGVDNVVWVMNYMGYHMFDCMTDALYPGDDLVDWILFNGYDQGDDDVDFEAEVRSFYDHLSATSRPGHDYASKPWGLAEWGIYDSSQESAYRYYAQAARAVADGTFSKLKMYLVFDSMDYNTRNGSYRVGFDAEGRPDPREQQAFNEFASLPELSGRWTFAR